MTKPAKPPQFDDPRGLIAKLRQGEVPGEALAWLVTGHHLLVEELTVDFGRVRNGKSAIPLRFLEGPPGAGKSTLLGVVHDLALRNGFAVCSLSVDSTSGSFTERRYLVGAIFRGLKALDDGQTIGWDGVLKRFCKSVLNDFPQVEEEGLNDRDERLRRHLASKLSQHLMEEPSVEDAIASYLYGFEANDPVRMRKVVQWFVGESLTAAELHSQVGAETKLDEKTALPILRSSLGIMVEAGVAGLVLLVDELVQSMWTHHESQRQRTFEITRLLYAGDVPRTVTLVAATPEAISDPWRGLAAHPGMKSRLEGANLDPRDAERGVYQIGLLSRKECGELLTKLRSVYESAYSPESLTGLGDAQPFVDELCPEEGVLPRDFVKAVVRLFDRNRRAS